MERGVYMVRLKLKHMVMLLGRMGIMNPEDLQKAVGGLRLKRVVDLSKANEPPYINYLVKQSLEGEEVRKTQGFILKTCVEVSSEEVLEEMERIGVFPANAAELLCIPHTGEKPVVALGTTFLDTGNRNCCAVVIIQKAIIGYVDEKWPAGTRFLAITK